MFPLCDGFRLFLSIANDGPISSNGRSVGTPLYIASSSSQSCLATEQNPTTVRFSLIGIHPGACPKRKAYLHGLSRLLDPACLRQQLVLPLGPHILD